MSSSFSFTQRTWHVTHVGSRCYASAGPTAITKHATSCQVTAPLIRCKGNVLSNGCAFYKLKFYPYQGWLTQKYLFRLRNLNNDSDLRISSGKPIFTVI